MPKQELKQLKKVWAVYNKNAPAILTDFSRSNIKNKTFMCYPTAKGCIEDVRQNNIMQKSFLGLFLTIVISTNAYSQNWDINLLNDINPQNPSSSYWQKTSSTTYVVGVGVPATQLIVGFIKKDKNLQHQGLETIGGLAINSIVTYGLKYTVNRERPYDKYPLLINPYQIEDSHSFPSGHTSTAFSLATSLSIQYKKWYVVVPAYAWASSVGYSRLYLGEHYPSDVLAGAAVGAGSALLSHYLNKKYFSNTKHK